VRPPESDDDGAGFLLLNRQRRRPVDRKALSVFLTRIVADLAPSGGFSVVLVSDRAIRKYNRAYRGKDDPTDVLSFPGDAGYLGDILISVETADRQAGETAGLTPRMNLNRLVLHGVLHLLGYDHETDKGEMKALEIRLRRRFKC